MDHKKTSIRTTALATLVLGAAAAPAFSAPVDQATYNGFKIYKQQRCETCHGATGEGSAAFPNLLNSLKNLSKDQFKEVVLKGRNAMPPFEANKKVAEGIDDLYTYIKGRSDGTVPAGELEKAP
ncbi:MAG: cytochrome c [Pseudomonadota bacterium]|jgi:mono/diheme cytochrome c family protein